MKDSERAAIQTAKRERAKPEDGSVLTLTSGVRVRLLYVSPATIAEAVSSIKKPEVPTYVNKSKGREEPNYNDPGYVQELQETFMKRANAAMNTVALLAVELADGLPEDDTWLKKLKFLERTGSLDLSGFDLDDPVELEFLYKKHIAIGPEDWDLLFEHSGVTEEGVAQATDLFRG